jgi:hypothetical protein
METTRKNRQTKTLITVANWNDQWFTICEEHEIAVGHKTKTQAMEWSSTPLTWCERCQEGAQ